MIRAHRIWAYVLRHLYEIKQSIDRKADIFLFPTIDLLVFGLLTSYIEQFNIEAGIGGMIIGGIILWTLLYNIQRDISFTALEDAWSRNFYNLFATPLRLSEIITGTLILSIIKAVVAVIFMLILSSTLFHFNLLSYGWVIAFYVFNIFVFGWAFGFITGSLIFRFGTKVQAVAWSLILVIYPISGVFYPLDTLPSWLVSIAHAIPVSYVFEGFRDMLVHGTLPSGESIWIIGGLNLVYLMIGIWLFVLGFKNAKKRGWFINPI